LKASQDDAQYRICQNTYLANNATALTYEVKISSGSDTWSYDETTMVRLNEFDEPFAHTDHNTLRRVD
jgi:hypothetical protein